MNIIFGEAFDTIPQNYTILELDTFLLPPDRKQVTSYCVVEKIPLHDLAVLDSYKTVHADLIKAYGNQNWEYCEHAIRGLTGRWNGEVDTFYENLFERVQQFKLNPPGPDWSAVIDRTG